MKIDAKKLYSLKEIAKSKLLPGRVSFTAVKNAVLRDRMEENILKATILGTGNATRFYIEGKNLIRFVSGK